MSDENDFHPLSSSFKLNSSLFSSSLSSNYLEEWITILKNQETTNQDENFLSVVVFRLGKEWLALKTAVFKTVISRRIVHQIPHKQEKFLKGVINLEGELQLCIALNELLEIEPASFFPPPIFSYQQNRMIAIEKDKNLWVFAVDEIEGVCSWQKDEVKNICINSINSCANYLYGRVVKDQKNIGLIDEDLLFYSLSRSLL